MELHSLGESAWLIYLMEEAAAVRLSARIRDLAPIWLQDVVPAYASVGVHFDADRITSVAVAEWIRSVVEGHVTPRVTYNNGGVICIPICYERGPDLTAVSTILDLTTDAIIELHSTTIYTVHAIGFVPGFPYLGYLPQELYGVPRLASPRNRVEPGSVGITGRQTGIYPLARPGGWHLIGQTPLILVDVAEGFFPLRVGDRISFTRIDEVEYHQLHGQRVCRPV
jgi:inhibitor of KinA